MLDVVSAFEEAGLALRINEVEAADTVTSATAVSDNDRGIAARERAARLPTAARNRVEETISETNE